MHKLAPVIASALMAKQVEHADASLPSHISISCTAVTRLTMRWSRLIGKFSRSRIQRYTCVQRQYGFTFQGPPSLASAEHLSMLQASILPAPAPVSHSQHIPLVKHHWQSLNAAEVLMLFFLLLLFLIFLLFFLIKDSRQDYRGCLASD